MTRVSVKNPGFYSYLIITPTEYKEAAESLKIYREEEGISTKVLTIEEIKDNFSGQDIAEKIRNAISFFYYNMGIRYVFLAADNDKIPARVTLVRLGYGEDDYVPSDYYYMCLNGSWNMDGDYTYGEIEDSIDLFPEVAVTRGTFNSKDDFINYLYRLKKFESNPISGVSRALFHSSTIQADGDGSDYVNQIAGVFSDSIQKYFLYQDDSTITSEDINQYLKSGVGYFVSMAHGDINGFYANYANIYYGMSSIPDDTTAATLVDIFSCHSGAIDRSSLLEAFFKKGISISARASSRNDFSFTTSMRVRFYSYLMEGETLGDATMDFRLPFLSYGESGDNGYRYVILSMITLGEPLIEFYSETPRVLYASYKVDSNIVHIFVQDENSLPLNGAVVTLYKEGEYFVSDTTSIDGEVDFPITLLSAGTHHLTVKKYNYTRLDTTVYVPEIGYPLFKYFNVVENGQGVLCAGDSVKVEVGISAPHFYPFSLAVKALLEDSTVFVDTVSYIGDNIEYAKSFLLSYFSGIKRLRISAEIVNKDSKRDTVLHVYGPVITLSGIKVKNDSLLIWIGNAGAASDSVSVKYEDNEYVTAKHILLTGKDVIPMRFYFGGVNALPAIINVHSNVFDTTLFLKDINMPSVPSGIVSTSISKGVVLKWNSTGTFYNVYRGTDSVNLHRINISPLLYPYYRDEGLSFDTIYFYALTSLDSNGFESNISEVVKGIPNPPLKLGWPATASGLGYSSPLVADITPLSPGKEIVIGSFEDSSLYAFSSDGVILPGWPVKLDGIIYGTPAAYDIDGDGFDEVIIAGYSCRKLWVFKGDGTTLDGWPAYLPNGNFTGPAIGDVNNDSVPEIVFVSRKGGVYVYNTHGVMLDSLHLYAGGFSPATLADINNDDTLDIITGCKVDTAGLWVMHMVNDTELVVNQGFPKGPFGFGSPLVVGDIRKDLPGKEIFGCSTDNHAVLYDSYGDTLWSRPISNLNYFYAPSVSDIDGDSVPELLVNEGGGVVVFRNDGTYFQGYPTSNAQGGLSQCITTDLNNDGYKEIIRGSVDGKLYALTRNANMYPGFPIDLLGYAYPTSTIDDIDYDGELELVAASFSNMVFVYDLGIPDSFMGDWPTYQHDIQRTGNYDYVPINVSYVKEKEGSREQSTKDIVIHGMLDLGEVLNNARTLKVYDITGREVMELKGVLQKKISLSKGIYFLIARDRRGVIYKKRVMILP